MKIRIKSFKESRADIKYMNQDDAWNLEHLDVSSSGANVATFKIPRSKVLIFSYQGDNTYETTTECIFDTTYGATERFSNNRYLSLDDITKLVERIQIASMSGGIDEALRSANTYFN